MGDRALAEVRWAAITFAAMAILALVAKLIDPADANFDRALLLATPAALATFALGWSRRLDTVVHRPLVRLLLGPIAVLVAMAAGGLPDVATLTPPAAGPLVVLGLTFAAITPGFPIAALIVLGSSVTIAIAHAGRALVAGPAALVSDEFVVRAAVALVAATGMYLVVRIATTAEDRAARLAAQSGRRVDHLERLERIVRRFDGTRSVHEVIQGVVDDVSREFEIALVSIYLPRADGRLSMVGVAGYHSPFHVIEPGVGVIGRAASTRTTQFVADVLADPDYRAARDDVRNEVAAPIMHDGELLGVINFEGTLRRPLGTTHVALAEMLGRAIAASLRSARLDEERRDRLHAIERVLTVSRGVLSDLDRRRTIGAVVEAAVDLLSAEQVIVAGRGPDGDFRLEGDSSDPGDGSWRTRTLDPADDAVAFEAIAARHAIVAPGVIALPIRVADDVVAVLVASRPDGSAPFGELERSVGDLLAIQVGVALQNADRHATVTDAAARDPLTGLLNRRLFDEVVEGAFASARRSGLPLSLVVLDLDRFSAVNNEHGHAVGDAVLRSVARAVSDSVRAGDTVIRYGGEELVVVLPGAGADEAVTIAERIRSAVGAAQARGVDTPPIGVTISAGVASLLDDEVDGHALFRAADSALLTAKRAGRDRVVAV